jgi:uncharacterized membrane protein YhfC
MPGIFVSAAVIVQAGIVLSTLFWAKKKNRGDMQPVIIGAVTFYVFVLLLENILNYALVLLIPNWKAKISGNVVSYVLYGCSMAALFEENGRYYSFTRVIKTYKEPEAALGYGAGHGGLEMVLSGILALMLLRPEAFAAVDSSLWVIERTAALAGHIALSVIVFYGVQRARKRYLLLAIALHGIADIPIGLYKYGAISLIACDALFATAVFLCGITAFWCYAHLSKEKDPIDDRKGQHGNGPPKSRIFSRQN